MLSEVTPSSHPGSGGVEGVPPVATSTCAALNVRAPPVVCTLTRWPSSSSAQPRRMRTPAPCRTCS